MALTAISPTTIGDGDGNISWRSVARRRGQGRESRGALDQIVVGWFSCIRAGLAVTEYALHKRCGGLPPPRLRSRARSSGHCLRSHVVHQRLGLRASLSNASRPAGSLRSTTMLRLPRLTLRNIPPMPGVRPGPICRTISPSGLSTLMTSAPMSARIWVAGPHQDGRQIENFHAGERAHGRSLMNSQMCI